jgi:hypothetical protein
MWGEDKRTPMSRRKGDKASHFTEIRHKLAKMDREEWLAWYGECIESIQNDREIWNWISRERGSQPIPQILKKNKMGRAPKSLLKDLPDTRNTNHDVD